MRPITAGLLLVLTLGVANVRADGMQPYVLAYTSNGQMAAEISNVKSKLGNAGFSLLGEYSPYDGAWVGVVTNETMKKDAAKDAFGGFAAVEHVAITDENGSLQVAYLNPQYMAAAYRLSSDYADIGATLRSALGDQQEFGTKAGRTKEDLHTFHYMMGMEHFDDAYKLGHHPSYDQAVKTVEENLRNGVGGAALVYRLDIPGKQQTIFGVSRAKVGDQRANDKHIMADTVDLNYQYKTTAYLPYEMMVNGPDVLALHMRFRMAVWHPDLTMGTFGKLMSSPSAIEDLLGKVAGGQKDSGAPY